MTKIRTFLALVWTRLKADSPAFFRKMGNGFVAIVVFCVSMQEPVTAFVTTALHLDVVPSEWLVALTRYIGFGAAVGKMVTMFTVDPRRVTERTYEKLNPPADTPPA